MTDDALAPYRLDQPLAQDEEAVVRIAAVEEHLAQGGVTVQRREDGCYLSFSQGNSDSKYPPAEPGALVCEPLKAANQGR